jgi:hypothetical protein
MYLTRQRHHSPGWICHSISSGVVGNIPPRASPPQPEQASQNSAQTSPNPRADVVQCPTPLERRALIYLPMTRT